MLAFFVVESWKCEFAIRSVWSAVTGVLFLGNWEFSTHEHGLFSCYPKYDYATNEL
jgi:hypothetical protein